MLTKGRKRPANDGVDPTDHKMAVKLAKGGPAAKFDVPFYIRAGKNLPVTCTEVLARFRKPTLATVPVKRV